MSQAADRRKGVSVTWRDAHGHRLANDQYGCPLTDLRSGRDRRMAEVGRRQGDKDTAAVLASHAQAMENLKRVAEGALEEARRAQMEAADWQAIAKGQAKVLADWARVTGKAVPDEAALCEGIASGSGA